MVDARRIGERRPADGVGDHVVDLPLDVAERPERVGHGAVDDLEIAAAGELLELDQGEVGLDAGGVAVHDEADGAGRGDDGDLRVAITVPLAEAERRAPGRPRRFAQRGEGRAALYERGVIERGRGDRQALVAGNLAVGGALVVADDAQHRLRVRLHAGEGARLGGEFGRGRIGAAGHHRRQRAADRPPLVRIVGDAAGHQEAADVGVAEAERAVLVGEPGDLLRGELRHRHRDFERQRPQPDRVLVGCDIKDFCLRVEKLQQVQRGEIAGRVVEEHVFRARVRGADRPRRRAGVPVVDGGVVLDARIGGGPGGVADLLPKRARLDGLGGLAAEAPGQVPVGVGLDRMQEGVGHPHRIVGVLARDGEIGLGFPVGVVGVEVEGSVTLAGELDDPLDDAVGHVVLARQLHLALQRRVLLDVEAVVAGALAVDAGLEDRLEVALDHLGAGGERRDLLLLLHLPVDVGFDVGVIDVDHHHLGRAPGGAARLDRAGGPVADLQKGHQARGAAAAGELFVLAAQRREVGTGAGAIFEQARLAHPQVHDAALVDEVVGDGLDEAGVRLGMLISRLRLDQLAGLEVDVIVALARPVDAIGPVEAGVEPLRRIRRGDLARQHEAHLVEIGARVLVAIKDAGLPAPIGPGAGEPVEHLPGGGLGAGALGLRQRGERLLVGNRAPQERRDVGLLILFEARRNAGLAEVFLGEHVRRHLAPGGRDLDVVEGEDDRAVRIANLAAGGRKRDPVVGRSARLGKVSLDFHVARPRLS